MAESGAETFLMTSESVGEGHPDKLCDQVSDAVLDACLQEDKDSKVACECATKTGMLMIFGEISTKAKINYQKVVRDMVKKVGYDDSSKGFDYKICNVMAVIEEQTPDIAQGVHLGKKDEEIGAGDQGMMFGYATDETDELMPLSIVLAHKLNKRLADCRRSNILDWINPDSKTQVTVEYKLQNGACVPIRVHTIVISVHHKEGIELQKMKDELKKKVIDHVVDAKYLDADTKYHLQPSGKYVIGGPMSDAGCTGRKIIVDTYGGWGGHGGGAFSGKDPSKVDRSACYAARWVAKSLVAAGLARRVKIQLSYAIGVSEPLSVYVDTYGTGTKSNNELLDIINRNFDLRPGCIIRDLNLKRPIYRDTACYGHFGRSEFTWEVPKPLQGL